MYFRATLFKNNKARLIFEVHQEPIGEHQIYLDTEAPIAFSNRRFGHNDKVVIENKVTKLLEKGVIRRSVSLYRAPPVLVPKENGALRICNDFRLLNQHTVRESYPAPRIEEIFDCMSGCSIFSKMSTDSGFHQVEIKEADKPKTVFSCRSGVYEYKRMPFGLVNAPSTLQRIMDDILREYLWKFVVVYMDDVIVFSKNLAEHVQHLSLVKDKIKRAG